MPLQGKFDPPTPNCLPKPNPPVVFPGSCDSRQSALRQSQITPGVIMKKIEAKDMDFDDLLPHVGEFGFYQKILFILMIPFAFFVAWVYFSQIFITLVPEGHWCRVPQLVNLTVEQRSVLSHLRKNKYIYLTGSIF